MSITVKVNGNSPEALDSALKKLKNKIKKSNIMIDLKRSEYFMKPSERKRQKRLSALARNRKQVQLAKEHSVRLGM